MSGIANVCMSGITIVACQVLQICHFVLSLLVNSSLLLCALYLRPSLGNCIYIFAFTSRFFRNFNFNICDLIGTGLVYGMGGGVCV